MIITDDFFLRNKNTPLLGFSCLLKKSSVAIIILHS